MKIHEQLQNLNADTDEKIKVWRFHCPGCKCSHRIVEKYSDGRAAWTFNGDKAKPTFSPSILVSYDGNPPPDRPNICHSYVTDGNIQFVGDCTHELKGTTVELPEW